MSLTLFEVLKNAEINLSSIYEMPDSILTVQLKIGKSQLSNAIAQIERTEIYDVSVPFDESIFNKE